MKKKFKNFIGQENNNIYIHTSLLVSFPSNYLELLVVKLCWNKWYVTLHLELHHFNFLSCILSWRYVFSNFNKLKEETSLYKLVYKYNFKLYFHFFNQTIISYKTLHPFRNSLMFNLLHKIEFVESYG